MTGAESGLKTKHALCGVVWSFSTCEVTEPPSLVPVELVSNGDRPGAPEPVLAGPPSPRGRLPRSPGRWCSAVASAEPAQAEASWAVREASPEKPGCLCVGKGGGLSRLL